MVCSAGADLIRQYRDATQARADARDNLLLFPATKDQCEERLFLAKRRYSQAFVAWVTHRAFCLNCRAAYSRDDQLQFASV